MRKIIASLAALLAMAFMAMPASANGSARSEARPKAAKVVVHRHAKRCHHHHRHVHKPRVQHNVMYYYAEPRQSWHAYRYYAVPYYAYRPHYFSAWGYPYRAHRWHHRHW